MRTINHTTQFFLNWFLGETLQIDGILGNKTKEAVKRANNKLSSLIKSKGFAVLQNQFVFLRTQNQFDNKFSDWFIIYDSGIKYAFPCSTRAGDFWVFNPISYGGITGTAVLAEGQYENAWQCTWQTRFGFRSLEFIQIKPVKIWRDGNKNRQIDKITTQTGLFGINLHTAGLSTLVDRWSAGCIVVPSQFWKQIETLDFKVNGLYSGSLIEI